VNVNYNPAPSSPADATSDAAAPTTYIPVIPSTPAFDPGTLDNALTDQTPFTAAALLPQSLTDSRGIHYSQVAAGAASCSQTGSMSSNVQYVLKSNGCTCAMAGEHLEDGGTDNTEVLVSVQVFPFATASTASRVRDSLNSGGPGNFGIFCPATGLGNRPCATPGGYTSALKSQYIRPDHRYLIEATALYTNMTQDSTAEPYTTSAAQKAVGVCGPENYAGNQ
jgi:hypothetical protein